MVGSVENIKNKRIRPPSFIQRISVIHDIIYKSRRNKWKFESEFNLKKRVYFL